MTAPISGKSSQRLNIAAIFFVLTIACSIAWFDSYEFTALELAAIAGFFALCQLCHLGWKSHRNVKFSSLVPLDKTDHRPLLTFTFLVAVLAISYFNPSHDKVLTDVSTLPPELQGRNTLEMINPLPLEFRDSFVPKENVIAALPQTVNQGRTLLLALQLIAAIFVGVTVAHWTRHHPPTMRFACALILISGIILSWIALHYKIEEATKILGRYEAVNPRFYGPFRYNNFWVAWIILVFGAGTGLAAHYFSKRRWISFGIATLGVLSLIPPLVVAGSRSAFLILGLFLLINLLRLVFLFPFFARFPRKNLWLGSAGIAAISATLVLLAVVLTWDSWATKENAERQTGRMRDTIYQLTSLREGKLPDLRPALARDALKLVVQKPVWGWGLGSYEYAQPTVAGPEFLEDRFQHQTKYYGHQIRARHAHNDWTQYWAELGTVGFAFLLLTIGLFWLKHTRTTHRSAISSSLLTGCFCVLVFALWDFPLNNFAVQCLFAACLGLAASSRIPSRTKFRDYEQQIIEEEAAATKTLKTDQ